MKKTGGNKIRQIATELAFKNIEQKRDPMEILDLAELGMKHQCIPKRCLQHQMIELPCTVFVDEETGDHTKTTYLFVPRDQIYPRPEGGFVVKPYSKKRKEYIMDLSAFRTHLLRKSKLQTSPIERFIADWGTEIYQMGGIDIFHMDEDTCHMCGRKCLTKSYKIAPAYAGMIEGSGTAILSLQYPCQYTNVEKIIYGRNLDPPRFEIAFPSPEKVVG